MTLHKRIAQLAARHGSLRALADAAGINASYLSPLASGEKTEPSDEVLQKLGLRRVVTYAAVRERT